jgi:hypothetical protein
MSTLSRPRHRIAPAVRLPSDVFHFADVQLGSVACNHAQVAPSHPGHHILRRHSIPQPDGDNGATELVVVHSDISQAARFATRFTMRSRW